MSIPSRHSRPENVLATLRTFFVSSSTFGKRSLLQSTRAAELFVDVLYTYRGQKKYLLRRQARPLSCSRDRREGYDDRARCPIYPRVVLRFELHVSWGFIRLCGKKVFRRFVQWMPVSSKMNARTFTIIPFDGTSSRLRLPIRFHRRIPSTKRIRAHSG